MTRKLIILFSIGIAVLFIASGCGSGGGAGRYTIPPEVPSPGPDLPTGPGIPGEVDADSLLASAWEDFRFGAYSSAINKFNQVLTIDNVTDSQRAAAYNGLGWSLTKSSGVESAYSAFSQAASSNNEARVGLAAALIQRGQRNGFRQAIQLLEEVGLHNTAFEFQSTNPIGVSSAEARAMLAFCYFWRNEQGDADKARTQINIARAQDPSNDSSVAQIYQTLKNMGLSGI